jgi:hypothetical protein
MARGVQKLEQFQVPAPDRRKHRLAILTLRTTTGAQWCGRASSLNSLGRLAELALVALRAEDHNLLGLVVRLVMKGPRFESGRRLQKRPCSQKRPCREGLFHSVAVLRAQPAALSGRNRAGPRVVGDAPVLSNQLLK